MEDLTMDTDPCPAADCPIAPLLERMERREERLADVVRQLELTGAEMRATVATFDDRYDHLRRKIELESAARAKALDDLRLERSTILETRGKVWVAAIGGLAVVVAALISTLTSRQATALAREQANGVAVQRLDESSRRLDAAIEAAAREGARKALESRQGTVDVITAR